MVPDNNQQFGPIENTNVANNFNLNKKHNYRMIIITVAIVIIAIFGFVISKSQHLQQVMKRSLAGESAIEQGSTNQGKANILTSSIASRERAWLEVVPEKLSYSKDETVVVFIKAFSEGKDITGYDMLIKVDPELFNLKSASSAISGFTVLPFEKGSYIAITAIKDIGQTGQSILNNTNVLKLEFSPKKQGESTISISLNEGKEKTQLIDTDVNVIIPQIGSSKIQVN